MTPHMSSRNVSCCSTSGEEILSFVMVDVASASLLSVVDSIINSAVCLILRGEIIVLDWNGVNAEVMILGVKE